MLLRDLVEASEAVAATPGSRAKVERLAERAATTEPEEVPAGGRLAVGRAAPAPDRRRLGGAARRARRRRPTPSLGVGEVDAAFERIGAAGAGLAGRAPRACWPACWRARRARAGVPGRLLSGELRQGALAGVMVEAVAAAAGLPAAAVRRALMLRGDLGAVAAIALAEGAAGLDALRLQPGRPLAPMLARPAPDIATALAKVSPAGVEFKLDGARIQVHRDGSDVAVFTRSLDDVTARVPEIVEAALALPVRAAVLDGEAIALRPDGRPHPFQTTAARFGSRRDVAELRDTLPLTPSLFDLLHLDGDDLLDLPGDERVAALAAVVPEGAARPARGGHGRRGGGGGVRRRAGPRSRGRRGQGARRALRGRAPRGGLAQGQAPPHARPRRARRRVGPRAPARASSATCTWARATPPGAS